jgi:GT2 family glycosyltransferase
MEVVVVDNASEDGSAEMVRAEFPEVVLLAETMRHGFGANQNLAVAASTGDALYILNPDTVVHEDTIDRLVSALVATGFVGGAGGAIRNGDGSVRQDHLHPFPTPMSPYVKALGFRRLGAGRPRRAGEQVGWPSGGACLVDRVAFDEIGGFDEAFFMYSEDADLFARMTAQGRRVVWVGDATVTHPYPLETDERSIRRMSEVVQSELRYMRKHHGASGALVYRLGAVVDAALRVALFSLPALQRLGNQDGMGAAYNRRYHAGRLRALLAPSQPGLRALADDWNRRNRVGDDPDAPAPMPSRHSGRDRIAG